jgi:hypothetical protein
MGIASSSSPSEPQEGVHLSSILTPQGSIKSKLSLASGAVNKSNITGSVKLSRRAQIVKNISYEKLWNNFLNSTADSFALSHSEAIKLLTSSYVSDLNGDQHDENKKNEIALDIIKSEVDEYVELLNELGAKESSKAIDFMSLCSSVMLLNLGPIEKKIDQLFLWITLSSSSNAVSDESFSFDDLFLALISFERGLSHAMGKPCCSESYVRQVTAAWMSLADPQHRDFTRDVLLPNSATGSVLSSSSISSKQFFDFATNRQHSVRRLLEALSTSFLESDKGNELQEVVTNDILNRAPSGGDEFLANPAWKKTAEKMVPKGVVRDNSKPNSNLSLEWVHGYRGFDCRNNVRYVTQNGSQVAFTAAGLSIIQDNNIKNNQHRTQNYFGEHSDDIISFAIFDTLVLGNPNTNVVIATGEIGKKPAIYLYLWVPNRS